MGVGKGPGGGLEFEFGSIRGYCRCDRGEKGDLGVGVHVLPLEALDGNMMESRTLGTLGI